MPYLPRQNSFWATVTYNNLHLSYDIKFISWTFPKVLFYLICDFKGAGIVSCYTFVAHREYPFVPCLKRK